MEGRAWALVTDNMDLDPDSAIYKPCDSGMLLNTSETASFMQQALLSAFCVLAARSNGISTQKSQCLLSMYCRPGTALCMHIISLNPRNRPPGGTTFLPIKKLRRLRNTLKVIVNIRRGSQV